MGEDHNENQLVSPFHLTVEKTVETYGDKSKQCRYSRIQSQLQKRIVDEFNEKFANPYIAAERGFIDEVIEPAYTRPKLIRALKLLENKRDTNPPKKHGNIPL